MLTSLTEQVHYRENVTTLQCISLNRQKLKKKKRFSYAEIDMRHRAMSDHSCNVFQEKTYRSKLAKRINEFNSSAKYLFFATGPKENELVQD